MFQCRICQQWFRAVVVAGSLLFSVHGADHTHEPERDTRPAISISVPMTSQTASSATSIRFGELSWYRSDGNDNG